MHQLLPIEPTCRRRPEADAAAAGPSSTCSSPSEERFSPSCSRRTSSARSTGAARIRRGRAGRAHDRDEVRHRQRRRHDHDADAAATTVRARPRSPRRSRRSSAAPKPLKEATSVDDATRASHDATDNVSDGKIAQVVGPVVDVEFAAGPAARRSTTRSRSRDDETARSTSTSRSQQHLGGNVVRAVAMDSTDGLVRGMEVVDTGAPIRCRSARALGRIFNVARRADRRREPRRRHERRWPIHRAAAAVRRARARRPRSSRPASRSSTCSRPTSRAARSASSAAPASARRSSSRS